MTKLEELREKVRRYKPNDQIQSDVQVPWGNVVFATADICVVYTSDLDSLISAAHAEGVVEGAERERERIRNLGTLHDKGNGFPFYSVVASVLVPTKEKP